MLASKCHLPDLLFQLGVHVQGLGTRLDTVDFCDHHIPVATLVATPTEALEASSI